MHSELFQKAFRIAQDYDVSTPKDSAVLYSVSYLPSKENRDNAVEYVRRHPGKMMIEHTDCGAKLVELGLSSRAIASKRFIEAATGDVTAFVKGADPRGVFRKQELPSMLENTNITSINGENKFNFAKRFEK